MNAVEVEDLKTVQVCTVSCCNVRCCVCAVQMSDERKICQLKNKNMFNSVYCNADGHKVVGLHNYGQIIIQIIFPSMFLIVNIKPKLKKPNYSFCIFLITYIVNEQKEINIYKHMMIACGN